MGTLSRGIVGAADERKQHYLVYATASMHSGLLLEGELEPDSRERLEGLAATLPELYGSLDASCLDRLSAQLGEHAAPQLFGEMLLLSDERLHLIQPLGARPGVALLAISTAPISVGLALSEFHARAAALEGG